MKKQKKKGIAHGRNHSKRKRREKSAPNNTEMRTCEKRAEIGERWGKLERETARKQPTLLFLCLEQKEGNGGLHIKKMKIRAMGGVSLWFPSLCT